MSTYDISTGFLAPSQYFGRVLGKEIREAMPKDNGKQYQVKCSFSNEITFKDRTYPTNALNANKACRFNIMIVEGTMRSPNEKDKLFRIFSERDKPYWYPEKQYTIKGWIEVDWDKTKKIDVFYEVFGNVMRDPKTAVAMTLL